MDDAEMEEFLALMSGVNIQHDFVNDERYNEIVAEIEALAALEMLYFSNEEVNWIVEGF